LRNQSILGAGAAMADMMEITYDGGLATSGQLHFYEYSRASYAFARLLNTAEHFRRTGYVAQKVGKKNYVDLIIAAPKEGSFVTEVIVPAVVDAVPKLAAVSIKGMVAYIFQLLSPRSKATDETIIELAKIRLAEEKERTAQSVEETKRTRALQKIVETETATTREALDLVKFALKTTNRAVDRLQPERNAYVEIAKELEAEREREKEIKAVEKHLEKLDPQAVARLTSRVRPMINDMGLPLRKSAKFFTIGAANDDRPLAYFDADRVAAIQSKTTEEVPSRYSCRIRGYDRDAAVGKVKSEEFRRVLTFIVPPDRKVELQPKILAAMEDDVDTVVSEFLKIVDKSNQPTSLILLNVLTDEQATLPDVTREPDND
jgi:hypothetical protein